MNHKFRENGNDGTFGELANQDIGLSLPLSLSIGRTDHVQSRQSALQTVASRLTVYVSHFALCRLVQYICIRAWTTRRVHRKCQSYTYTFLIPKDTTTFLNISRIQHSIEMIAFKFESRKKCNMCLKMITLFSYTSMSLCKYITIL